MRLISVVKFAKLKVSVCTVKTNVQNAVHAEMLVRMLKLANG